MRLSEWAHFRFLVYNPIVEKEEETMEKEQSARIIRVVPIARGIGKEELTYFTLKDVREGCIVSVPIRKKQVPALVIGSEEAVFSRAELRSLPYGLRKISNIKSRALLLPAFVEAAKDTARHFATTTGAVLSALTPLSLGSEFKGPSSDVEHAPETVHITPKENATKQIPLLIQSADEERIAAYRGIVREEFARGGSVFLCMPEVTEIERAAETLSRGIPEYTIILHAGISSKKLAALWMKGVTEKHPVLIIGTGQFLSIPRHDIKTIIVEKESSRAYKTPARPHADIRVFAEIFAKHLRARIIFGDLFLRPETIARKNDGDMAEFGALAFRSLTTAEKSLIDMRKEDARGKNKFTIVSEELSETIKKTASGSEQTFLLSARRGLHSVTACNDCGSVVLCKRCSAPMALHGDDTFQKGSKNFFLCHKCGTREVSSDKCVVCGGWRFALLGAGTERVAEEMTRLFPEAHILRMDRDTVTTHKRAIDMREKFYNTPGAILVGTEMAVPYLNRTISTVSAISVDSLFAIPDFRINERVFALLLRMRSRAGKHFLIQTRDPENRILRYALDGNMIDFCREEIAERKIFGYPPFSTLIKVTREGTETLVRKDIETLAKTLTEYAPETYESFARGARGQYRMNLLLKIPSGKWIDEKLLAMLRALPPHYAVSVDPESLV